MSAYVRTVDGVLVQWDDDVARQHHYYDPATGVEFPPPRSPMPYTATENDDADAEQEQAARLTALEARVARLEAHAWPTPPTPTDTTGVKTWEQWQGVCPAGALVLDGGKVWRNVTTVPLTTPPSGFAGWTEADLAHLWRVEVDPTPPPPSAPAWKAGVAYKVGDLASYGGTTYKVVQAHTSQAGWEPPAVPALWAIA